MLDPVPLIIGSKSIVTSELFEVSNPATEQVAHHSSNANASHARAAVEAAAEAFESCKETTPQQRRAVFLRAAEILDKRYQELTEYMVQETAADGGWVKFNLETSKEYLLDCGGRIATCEGKIPALQNPSRGGFVLKEPYGVVLAMAPW